MPMLLRRLLLLLEGEMIRAGVSLLDAAALRLLACGRFALSIDAVAAGVGDDTSRRFAA